MPKPTPFIHGSYAKVVSKIKSKRFRKTLLVFLLSFSLLFSQFSFVVTPVQAASSPWSQTNWSGGSGQTSFTDTTKYDSGSGVVTSTSNQITLTNTEKLSNTGFETDLTSWDTGGAFSDTLFSTASGAVAAWPLDDTTSTQSYSRVVNPAVSTGRNLIVNGTFANSTGWTVQNGGSISSGQGVITSGAAGTTQMSQAPLIQGKMYSITFTVVSISSGGVSLGSSGSTPGTSRTTAGTYTEIIRSDATNLLVLARGTTTNAVIDDVVVNMLNISSNSATRTQLAADGDMEASGTSSWTAANGATLSKGTTSPHGGSQVLRITNTTSNAYASQSIISSGTVYRVSGYARSDGNATPYVNMGSTVFVGTTSTSWQHFDLVAVSAGTAFTVQSITSTNGHYVEFDDVVVSLDSGIRSDEILEDGNMEISDTSYWTTTNTTISKQTTSPHGGSRVLRVAYNGTSSGWAYPIARPTVGGKAYRVTGWARGDGTAIPRLAYPNSGNAFWTGTSSTSWQQIDTIVVPDSPVSPILLRPNMTSGYVEYDDLSITEVPAMVARPTNSVTVGSTSGGHLANAYTFDGTNDVVNIHSADFNSAFSPSEGTAVLWGKVNGASDWTDSTSRYLMYLPADLSNAIELHKSTVTNTLRFSYTSGGTAKTVTSTILNGSTDWFQMVLTWSKSSDQLKAYINGAQVGTTQTGLGTWAGNLLAANTTVGASNVSGANPWKGKINDVRIYNRALTSTEIAALYTSSSRDTSTTYNSTTGAAKVISPTDETTTLTQSVNVGDTNSYNLVAYAYTTGAAVTASDVSLYANGSTVSTTYTSVGSGWYRLNGTVTGVASSVGYGVQVQPGKTVYLDNFSLNNYTASGTLTSSIFDAGFGSDWGTLTLSTTTPSNTTATVKVRTSNDSGMSGATTFASCTNITSGTDISANSCVTDGHRYAQYQISLATSDNLNSSTFSSFSLPFSNSDVSAPSISLTSLSPDPNSDTTPTFSGTATDAVTTVSNVQFQIDSTSGSWTNCSASDGSFDSSSENFTCTPSSLDDGIHTIYLRATDGYSNTTSSSYTSDSFTIDTNMPLSVSLDSPGDNGYTNNERPVFRWKAASDTTSGISKYVLEIDNPSLGSDQPNADFTIDEIPASRTTDYETNRYIIRYENFSDTDQNNDYISVYTKSHSDWSTSQYDGKLREGRVSWKVKVYDNANNESSSTRTLFVDRSNPKLELNKINSESFDSTRYQTTSTRPTIEGKVIDTLAGGEPSITQADSGPKIASGPKEVTIKVEKKQGILYKLFSIYVINADKVLFRCDDKQITDNSNQKCDKYYPFRYQLKDSLDQGTYKFTVIVKDTADNTSQTSFAVDVVPLEQIVTQEEEKIIEETIKELPKEQQVEVKKNLEITKPMGPTSLEKASDRLRSNISNAYTKTTTTLGDAINWFSDGIKYSFGYLGRTVANIGNRTGTALTAISRATGSVVGNMLATLGRTASSSVAYINSAATMSAGFVGDKLSQGGEAMVTSLEYTSKTISTSYIAISDKSTGLTRSTLIGIGNITNATVTTATSVTTNITTSITGAATNLSKTTISFVGTTSSNISKGTTAFVVGVGRGLQNTGNNIVNTTQKSVLAVKNGIANTAFDTGVKAQRFSHLVGFSIVKFGYLFINEPTIIVNVKVKQLDSTSATITWQTNHPANGKVNYGLTPDYGQDVQSEKRVTDHEFTITGLKPGTVYHYEVMSHNSNYVYDANHSFVTASE